MRESVMRVFSKPKMFGEGIGDLQPMREAKCGSHVPTKTSRTCRPTIYYAKSKPRIIYRLATALLGPVMYQYGPEKPIIKD